MIQPYGATNHSGVDVEAKYDTTGEETSLLDASAKGQEVTKREGHATMVSGIGNFTNTIAGSGERHLYDIVRPLLIRVNEGMITFPLVRLPPHWHKGHSCSPSPSSRFSKYHPWRAYLYILWRSFRIWIVLIITSGHQDTP